ncbi:pilus assembly protein PilM [Candidatus Woesebacteria bacterium]|nr:pilus assembly protein PilM [Candidatus Woesebacteria bacterium]
MASNIFSLDLGEQFTRLAHLTRTKDKIEILSLGYDNTFVNFYSNPDEKSAQEQAKVISQLYSKLLIDSSKVHIVIPDTKTYSQLLLMPDLPEEELVKAIRLQADEFVPLPISEVYLDLEVIQKLPSGKLLIIFIASQKKIVDHIYKTLTYANLEPISLENELNAVGRFTSEFYKFIREPSLIVNFGYSGSSLYVVNPAFPYFQLTRTSRIGFDIILRDLKLNSNLTHLKALEALKTIGMGSNGSINVYSIIYPVLNELFSEMERTILLTAEKYHINIKNVYLMNYDHSIAFMPETVQKRLSIATQSFPLSTVLVPNVVTQTFSQLLSTFIPVISTNIR